MFEDIKSDRLPRTPRRALSAQTADALERLAGWLDRTGANSMTTVRDASVTQLRSVSGGRRRQAA